MFNGSRTVSRMMGTNGHNAVFDSNAFLFGCRWLNFYSYQTVTNNFVDGYVHHGLMAPNVSDTSYTNITVTGNIAVRFPSGASQAFSPSYNTPVDVQNITLSHNVADGNNGTAGFEFGDSFDGSGLLMASRLTMNSNIATNNAIGVLLAGDTTAYRSRMQVTTGDYNDIYGNTTNSSGFKFATFTGLSNITGVALQNPSGSYAAYNNRTLTYTYTSDSNVTLSINGGTAQQLVLPTNGTGTATAGSSTTLTDSTKTWATRTGNQTNSTSLPASSWLKISSGTGAGQIRRITSNPATVLTVSSAWTTTPDATSVYVIYNAKVVLPDGSDTVTALIDATLIPTSTQSDTVFMSFKGLAVDPAYVDRTRSVSTWDTSLGGSGTNAGAWNRLAANPLLSTTLISYLRAGFASTNSALKAVVAGTTDSLDVGAVSVVDVTPPVVSVTTPTGGATVSGASVSLVANATDNFDVANEGVQGVKFYYDSLSNLIGSEITSAAPAGTYSTTWDTTSVTGAADVISL